MELFVLVSLILFNGVFAMAELAILTAKRLRLETAAEQGNVGAAHALRLADNPNRFLSTVQVGITSIGVLSGIVGEAALAQSISFSCGHLGPSLTTKDGAHTEKPTC
jgi:putative hemolysin